MSRIVGKYKYMNSVFVIDILHVHVVLLHVVVRETYQMCIRWHYWEV